MDVLENERIPYRDLYFKLFDGSGDQKLIPFLGAGVPLSARPDTVGTTARVQFPEKEKIEEAINSLELQGRPRLFAAIALVTAHLMASVESSKSRGPGTSDLDRLTGELLERLTTEVYPPSTEELAQLISGFANLRPLEEPADALRGQLPTDLIEAETNDFILWLRRLLDVTGLSSGEVLATIAGYFETASGRQGLSNLLAKVFVSKNIPTATHDLLAEAASRYLNLKPKKKVIKDYLIITSNYDSLMEHALTKARVPFAVLLLNKKDGKIRVRFSETLEYLQTENTPCYASQFHLSRRDPLALVYKIHGSLADDPTDVSDSVVISDNDYVDYISRMSTLEGAIPAYVGNLMRKKPFLFLGYSLKDWNVRSVFETLVTKRGDNPEVRDYLVTRRFTGFDEAYCSKHKVVILHTDLNNFVGRIRGFVPRSAAAVTLEQQPS
jgi:hypothetical protein